MSKYLDDWTVKQVLRLRWLMNTELTQSQPRRRTEHEWERLKVSLALIHRVGSERAADAFDQVLGGIGTTLVAPPIGMRL